MATFQEALAVKHKHSAGLLKMPGVCGVDVQTDERGLGQLNIHVDAANPPAAEGLPKLIDGVPVQIVHDGPFEKQ